MNLDGGRITIGDVEDSPYGDDLAIAGIDNKRAVFVGDIEPRATAG